MTEKWDTGADWKPSPSPITHLPPRIDPGLLVRPRQPRLAEDMVGGLFAGHDGGAVEVAIGEAREDGAIRDAQAFDADDLRVGSTTDMGSFSEPILQVPQG